MRLPHIPEAVTVCREWNVNGHDYDARTIGTALRLYLAEHEREALLGLYKTGTAVLTITGGQGRTATS